LLFGGQRDGLDEFRESCRNAFDLAKGLSRLVGETCDYLVRIPMPGGAESLNAGVAAGVVLYEAARRRA